MRQKDKKIPKNDKKSSKNVHIYNCVLPNCLFHCTYSSILFLSTEGFIFLRLCTKSPAETGRMRVTVRFRIEVPVSLTGIIAASRQRPDKSEADQPSVDEAILRTSQSRNFEENFRKILPG